MKVLWGSFQDLGLDLRVSTPPASVFDLGFGSGVMAAMFLAVEEVEVVGVDLEDKVPVATATLRLKNWYVWRGSKNWSLLAWKLWELNPKSEFRLYIFPTICSCLCWKGFFRFSTCFFFRWIWRSAVILPVEWCSGFRGLMVVVFFGGFCKGCLFFVGRDGKPI